MKEKKLTPTQVLVLTNLKYTGALTGKNGDCCTARTFNHLHMDGLICSNENHMLIVSPKGERLLDALKKTPK